MPDWPQDALTGPGFAQATLERPEWAALGHIWLFDFIRQKKGIDICFLVPELLNKCKRSFFLRCPDSNGYFPLCL